MRTLSDLFKALSDETRLSMLALLSRHGELCVCDFVEAMDITQSKASRHLRHLAHAGLVVDRRDAVWVFYRLPDAPSPDAAAVLQTLRPVLASRDLGDLETRLAAWTAQKATSPACRKPVPQAPHAPGGNA
jgi:ArsR family transcriptional regulator